MHTHARPHRTLTPCPAPRRCADIRRGGHTARRSSLSLLPAARGGDAAVDSKLPPHLGSDRERSAEHHRPPTLLPAVDGAAGTVSTAVSSTWQIASAQFTATPVSVRPALGAPGQAEGDSHLSVPSLPGSGPGSAWELKAAMEAVGPPGPSHTGSGALGVLSLPARPSSRPSWEPGTGHPRPSWEPFLPWLLPCPVLGGGRGSQEQGIK